MPQSERLYVSTSMIKKSISEFDRVIEYFNIPFQSESRER